jgi:hypothetical protein
MMQRQHRNTVHFQYVVWFSIAAFKTNTYEITSLFSIRGRQRWRRFFRLGPPSLKTAYVTFTCVYTKPEIQTSLVKIWVLPWHSVGCACSICAATALRGGVREIQKGFSQRIFSISYQIINLKMPHHHSDSVHKAPFAKLIALACVLLGSMMFFSGLVHADLTKKTRLRRIMVSIEAN